MQDANDRQASAELTRLCAALAAAGEVAYDWDLVTDEITWFGSAEPLFGGPFPEAFATGAGFNRLVNPMDLPRRIDALSRHYYADTPYDSEFRIAAQGGDALWLHDQGVAEFSNTGEPIRLRGSLRRITERKRKEARLAFLANYDELTGHFNQSRLRDTLEQALFYSQRYGVDGAFLVIGLDKLTMVNDAFGHEVADSVIVALGKRLGQSLRASDSIGRLSGDRFGVVLSHCPTTEVENAAEKILQLARNTVIETTAGPIYITVSIGAMTFPHASRAVGDVMTKAEIALQWAKHRGRDCTVSYADYAGSRIKCRDHIVIAERVQRALKEDRLVFAYQPVVDAETLRPMHYECLLRMITPEGEVVAAAHFMPVVEKQGLIRLIDLRVLELVVQELARYPDAHIALNISGLTVTNRTWLAIAQELLRDYPDIARRLVVEITETTALEDFAECGRFVHALHDLGCRVALDDFGAGYTSFRHLKTLAVDMVKIDGSFIRNIDRSPDNLVFVRTLVGLAGSFALTVVAECVERREEAEVLSHEGVQLLQGYAFGAPSLERPWAPLTASPFEPVRLVERTPIAAE